MTEGIYIIKGELYISYPLLRSHKISQKDLENWSYRKVTIRKKIEGQTCVLFNSIPEKRRAELPSKEQFVALHHLRKNDAKIAMHYKPLYDAYTMGWLKYRPYYKEKYPNIKPETLNETAQLHAMWHYIITEGGKDNAPLFAAFDKVWPKRYASAAVFANNKNKAKDYGVEAVAFKRSIITGKLNINTRPDDDVFIITALSIIGVKHSLRQLQRMVAKYYADNGIDRKTPCIKTIRDYKQKAENNIENNASLNGKNVANAKQMVFTTMIHALHANSQWQIDAWTMPFWVDGFKRYVIVVVKDAYSKKIVGYAVGETENTITIMAALKDAIVNTGCLPYEILTDCHSANKTFEMVNFKEAVNQIGTKYNFTYSPTHKSIIERGFKELNSLCKEYWGYIGEGIKSKSKNAHPSQELIDTYAKNSLSDGEIKLIGIKIVEDFNNQPLAKIGKTPNQLFAESEKPHCFPVDIFERIKVLTSKTEFKVTRGQITIKRGMGTYEYQLPASLFEKYNNKVVTVRYEDLNEGIYIYDKKTDAPITQLNQKPKIHGALADQTQVDIDLLNQNKGRIEGIKSIARKNNAEILRKGLEANPEAINWLNTMLVPKDVKKEFEENATLKRIAEDKGINIKDVEIPNRKSQLDNDSLLPKKKSNDSPFNVPNATMKKVSRKDFYND